MGQGMSDAIPCDFDGNAWASAGYVEEGYDGVHIFTPDGDLIGKIHLPEVCANLRFGGVKRNRIFMTGSSRFTPSSLRHKEPRYHTLTRSLAEEELYL